MVDVKKDVKAANVEMPDFDKAGGTEVFFDRPMASSKTIPDLVLQGFLVGTEWLNKPKNQPDSIETDENDPNSGKFEAAIFLLTRPCKAYEGANEVIVPAGREVYFPIASKAKGLVQYLYQDEMYEIIIKTDGILKRPGSFDLTKFRFKQLGTTKRNKLQLALGGPTAKPGMVVAALPAGNSVPAGSVPFVPQTAQA